MKQLLKETIIVWIVIILILALTCVIVGVPSLIFTYARIGEWQLIVCILWLTFWLSFLVTVGVRTCEKESEG